MQVADCLYCDYEHVLFVNSLWIGRYWYHLVSWSFLCLMVEVVSYVQM